MKNKIYMNFKVALWTSRRTIINEYSKEFYKTFCKLSKDNLESIIDEVPNIGDSIFNVSYYFCPSYIAWYKAYLELGLKSEDANKMIWEMNETLVKPIPKIFMKLIVRKYIGDFIKKSPKHETLSLKNEVHKFDWKIRCRNISKTTFEIDIYECGMIKLCKKFDAMGLFPMMCRMDYLFAHYMGTGFERTKTLGDGDDCCNCKYTLPGKCEWAPEKGFENRK
ncbi:L-2-amino-thiazoline-4-carboxylic acid hydrolase [Clostridium cavendishii DSM 21758]|uniref:L-2-amino-thiazoline-4-carboxylic acid hydrolase n=1 Tax=Clostridium cavendishii DSM 21758 TaxID=1121302 RepID=A0A1M6D592_9CLOT|nr:L-2-amino-thiazoline-4-carboxylic acid hydrolase [Clostridium cavendishii]SHI68442.1 L-2-amino-thiazoline-4-carboxylic acid hydrolase [Clostridium cavendishii DSM 21758]